MNMNNQQEELKTIITQFAESGWDLIDAPSKAWLSAVEENGADEAVTTALIKAVELADQDCGSCGCSFDPLYKRALELLRTM